MYILHKTGVFKGIAIGITGGVAHNIVQILVAYFFIRNVAIFSYLPILIISGIICGALTGSLAQALYKRVALFAENIDKKETDI